MQDIHTHLYWESYDADRDLVVARAREAGVREMLVVGCTVDESRQAIAVAEQYDDMYVAVGIHPHEMNHLVENPKPELPMSNKIQSSKNHIEEWITELRELAKNKKVIAIGECGLDYYAHEPDKIITDEEQAVQKEGFLAQIALAQELRLPMILHCRPSVGTQDSYEDMFQMLQDSKLIPHTSYLILHCYMGDTEITKKFLMFPNVFFSFTGNITYPVKKALVGTKDDLIETVKLIPLKRLFVETDCPFLAPQVHRGVRNEPGFVVAVAEKIAEAHTVMVGEIEKITEVNFRQVFL